jgi:hypothetical protein
MLKPNETASSECLVSLRFALRKSYLIRTKSRQAWDILHADCVATVVRAAAHVLRPRKTHNTSAENAAVLKTSKSVQPTQLDRNRTASRMFVLGSREKHESHADQLDCAVDN